MSIPRGRTVNPAILPLSSSHQQQSQQQNAPAHNPDIVGVKKASPFKRLFKSARSSSSSAQDGSIVEEQPLVCHYNNTTTASDQKPKQHSQKVRLLNPRRIIMMKKRKAMMEDDDENVMSFLSLLCPVDVVPKVLAYCGPQKTAALSRTNRHWNSLIKEEGTWRVLCEELYKWKKGDPEPQSWMELYRQSPCVPIDYPTIPKALAVASKTTVLPRRRNDAAAPTIQDKSVRVLLRPDTYLLKESIVIQALTDCSVTIETIELPENLYRPPVSLAEPASESTNYTCGGGSTPFKETATSLRNLMLCRTPSTVEETEFPSDSEDELMESAAGANAEKPKKLATLILRTRRSNEPVFRVRQGLLHLKDLEIQHNSHGLDIWNGNAAVQVQPPVGDDNETPLIVEPRPCAWMEGVNVSSRSGRGIVNIDGGKVVIRSCAVTDCAATGIYIGGPGSQAYIEGTDVLRNGLGNSCLRRGIARGHSGIYLEQGAARIYDCNICENTLTGISAVSPENAILSLESTDLVANGSYQLEMPPLGTVSRQRSLTRQNHLAMHGQGRARSGLVTAPRARARVDEGRMLPV